MKVLLDTNIVSELRRIEPDPSVVEQVRAIGADHSFLSSITIGEFVYGIQRLPQSHKRDELEAWLFELERSYADHILPFDAETAHIWGELVAKGEATGRVLPIQDAQIGATASSTDCG
jgi:predicted nucleic acid-binding protein